MHPHFFLFFICHVTPPSITKWYWQSPPAYIAVGLEGWCRSLPTELLYSSPNYFSEEKTGPQENVSVLHVIWTEVYVYTLLITQVVSEL